MFRDTITNKWFLGGVAFLIVFTVACVFWYRYDTAPDRRDAAETAELLHQWAAKKVDTDGEAVDTPAESNTPTAEKSITEIAETNVKGKFLLEKISKMTQAEFEALPPAEQEALKQTARAAYWAERGLTPPPTGYTYTRDQDDYHLVKYGDPHFRITWDYGYHNDHQLSDTEWEEYKALNVIANLGLPGPRQPQATPEIVALAKEWYEKLKEKTWGPVPYLNTSASWSNRIPTQADYDRVDRLVMEKFHSLTPPPRSGVIDYTVVDRLLMELKTELERR